MQDYTKHIKNDTRLANLIFESAYSKQMKHPDKLINVGYGFRATRNNLEDAKLLISHKKLMLEFDLKDGLISRKFVEEQKKVLNQLEKSMNKTIVELYGKGENS